MKTAINILILNLVFCCSIFGQRSTQATILLDSLNNKVSYKANPREVIKLSKEVLKVGEKEKDTFLILRALHHLGRRSQFANENYQSIRYFNRELLFFTNNILSKKVKEELKETEIAPVEIYAQLGNNFSNLGDKKTALEYFNISRDIAEKENLDFYKAVIPALIGDINSSIKNYKEAINNYKLALLRLEKSTTIPEETKIFNIGITVTQLATNYLLNNNIDSAKIVLKEGFAKNYHKKGSSTIDISFKNVEAAILTKENKLTEAILKYEDIKADAIRIDPIKAILYYYKGYSDCLAKQEKYKEAAFVLEEGINELRNDVKEYSLADDYKEVAKYYKIIGNIEKSNEFYEKYVLSQSAIVKNKSDVVKIFHNKELSNLKLEKEIQKKRTIYLVTGGAIVIILLLLYLFNLSNKKKKDSKRFKELLNIIASLEQQQKIVDTKDIILEEKSTIDINKETVDEILTGLQKIEEQHYYLKQECNSYNVAKKIKTNTSYLSKVINAHYQKNFNTYINDLRINYAILKLKEDTLFRAYAIQSISKDIGYKSTDSFTKYFKRRTGLLPSVYIKKLNSIT